MACTYSDYSIYLTIEGLLDRLSMDLNATERANYGEGTSDFALGA